VAGDSRNTRKDAKTEEGRIFDCQPKALKDAKKRTRDFYKGAQIFRGGLEKSSQHASLSKDSKADRRARRDRGVEAVF
jgi:hypothetical protein